MPGAHSGFAPAVRPGGTTAPAVPLGDARARLLAGPLGRETFDEHTARLGPLPRLSPPDDALLRLIDTSGLTGRGGGHFPLAAKIAASRRAAGPATVVVNATESEPASAKDRLLLEHRPHLVLDGAVAVAAAAGADTIVVVTHEGSPSIGSIAAALAERAGREPAALPSELACVPDRYIAGESSALVSYLNGGPPVPPSRSRPTAECGVAGRPTVVSNAETLAHAALIARKGSHWFREAGGASAPGSLLITLHGDVGRPGTVLELLAPASLADVVEAALGPAQAWKAALVGGYAGTWVNRQEAAATSLLAGRNSSGPAIGSGLIAVLDDTRCGLAEASRLLDWLTAQRAGQCGACNFGLPLVAEQMAGLASGSASVKRVSRRVASLGLALTGRGLCHLPDGAVAMAESALVAFHEEARLHRRGRCTARQEPGALPLPSGSGGRR